MPAPERERDFALNRKAFVQAGQICDRSSSGFRRVLWTRICDDSPCLLRQYRMCGVNLRPDENPACRTCACCIRLLVSSSETTQSRWTDITPRHEFENVLLSQTLDCTIRRNDHVAIGEAHDEDEIVRRFGRREREALEDEFDHVDDVHVGGDLELDPRCTVDDGGADDEVDRDGQC